MKDFFISYNKADRTWAEWIAWQLEEEGYTVVVQAWDFRPGGNFVLDMNRAAGEAERTIAVLSPDFLTSEFAQSEWAARFAKDPTGKDRLLIPVRVRECDVEGMLGQIVYIDLLKLDKAAAKRELLEGVKLGRRKPDAEPGFPGSPSGAIANEPRFPGAMPAIWNIPHLRNPNFTGREEELSELRASLVAGETAALVSAQAIHGLGGVGKTQLAVEYAYRNGADYDVVWWVRSEDPSTLASDYAGLAAEVGLPESQATEQPVIVEAVKRWLRGNGNWLMIFDNAEDVKSVRDFIPPGHAGHIIITSRNPNWRNVAKPLHVEELPLDKAIEFLVKRTGDQDKESTKTLAEALGCLPLALEQAGAYIDASGGAMRHYLDLFETRQGELFEHAEASTDYPHTVATTWSISFGKVEEKDAAAADLLRLLAFFAPDDIPIWVLRDGAEQMPGALAAIAADGVRLDKAVMALRKYSLIEVENDAISIHRLVQAVIRLAMDDEALRQWTQVAVEVVNAAFPLGSQDVRTWPVCSALQPHASVILSYAEEVQLSSRETSRLLNQVGVFLNGRAEYAQAKSMIERSLAIDEAALGPANPEIAIRLSNLGLVLQLQGDIEGAKALFERALTIGEATFGSKHPHVATLANNLGNVLRLQGDLAGAKALYERALAIGEATLGPNHPSVAIRLSNLGGVLKSQGDLDGAKELYERALAIDEATLGPNHPEFATDLNNLALVLESQGDIAGAKALYERSLRTLRYSLGEDHPNTRTIQANLTLLEEAIKNAN
ncbi:MAG: FxSxx-COOH system tetratricopeptide repeat protein [Acidobacteriota bacterium]